MIVFGVREESVQASFSCACVSCCCCCCCCRRSTAIHRGHKESLYLNQGNPADDAGLEPQIISACPMNK